MRNDALITKPHYAILDGLRGVASVLVIAFHIFEAHSTSHFDQILNHGYLAVDFFFMLSGFVIGYAYDDRWKKMSVTDFFKIRLVRLQPLVVLGMIIGAICFYFQDSAMWPGIHNVPVWKMLLIMLIGMTLIPVPVSMDIRGWQEMHPLNGPGWSLFFEYVANILYAIVVRRFSRFLLFLLALISGAALVHLAVNSKSGDIIGGWSLDPEQLRIGFTRVMYPFFAGLLLYKIFRLRFIGNAFFWSSLLLLIVLCMPRVGGQDGLWKNGLYDSLTVILIFPLVVYIGACGQVTGRVENSICKFLGDISYPLYITHYPINYIYTGWVSDHHPGLSIALPVASLCFVSSIALAYASLKLFDEPVRKWLKKKILV